MRARRKRGQVRRGPSGRRALPGDAPDGAGAGERPRERRRSRKIHGERAEIGHVERVPIRRKADVHRVLRSGGGDELTPGRSQCVLARREERLRLAGRGIDPDDLLARLGLEPVARTPYRRLSGGQQQRVALTRALINDPVVILADEPTGNLDEWSARGVFELFRDINASGMTVVMATHDLDLVRANPSFRVIEMSHGEVVYDSGAAVEKEVAS
ncbi:MAG: ATP-binding cassette domain-containing protein [Gemmatimonadetes bacterium]|nr:ATP-binding cassette domain-containing protein [Gemmatimonadota bacterium]